MQKKEVFVIQPNHSVSHKNKRETGMFWIERPLLFYQMVRGLNRNEYDKRFNNKALKKYVDIPV